ncbi:MAG: hypothetical protein HY736_09000 [Verrucomicrobia bacterium]|nr:hypothetical protein [Verrucomicrobiota bacterium]
MKLLSPLLAVVVLILLAGLIYQHTKTTELQANLLAFGQDRDAMNRELRRLKSRIAELQRPPASSSTTTTTGAAARAEPSAAQPPPPAAAEPVATSGVTVTAPAGWWKNGSKPDSYVVGVDTLQTWGGMPSAYVKSVGDAKDAFGGMMQSTSAENFVGQRVRLNAWIKTEDANDGGGHLWLRIDGQERGQMLGFDNMDNRAVKGSSDWQEASVVLDVPAGASALAYGFFVHGGGMMWVNGQTIQEVGPEVPATNMLKPKSAAPKTPVNLGFDPDRPK